MRFHDAHESNNVAEVVQMRYVPISLSRSRHWAGSFGYKDAHRRSHVASEQQNSGFSLLALMSSSGNLTESLVPRKEKYSMLSIDDRNAPEFLPLRRFTGAYRTRNVSPRSSQDRLLGRAQ